MSYNFCLGILSRDGDNITVAHQACIYPDIIIVRIRNYYFELIPEFSNICPPCRYRNYFYISAMGFVAHVRSFARNKYVKLNVIFQLIYN